MRYRQKTDAICKIILFFTLIILSSCQKITTPEPLIEGTIIVDNQQIACQVSPGSTVSECLETSGVTLTELDRVTPDTFSRINQSGITIKVVRVTEEFILEEVIIPYDQQTIHNESFPEGESRLVQAGINGLEEITYRFTYEDGVEVSKTVFKANLIQEPVPEITMIGVKSPLLSINLPSPLVYLTGGNAWMMVDKTENRFPLVTTGDLDGRVFELSPDGLWLLFTRAEIENEEIINSLWVASLDIENPQMIDLGVNNIIHFADWHPFEPLQIAFSTVEPRDTAPGWQANNDLIMVSIDPESETTQKETIIDINAGGIYGWWGTNYLWSPNGKMAFVRPDSVGEINLETGTLQTFFEVTPYNTREDWAWTPGISWDNSGKILLVVTHPADINNENQENDKRFNLSAFILESNLLIDIVTNSGMFAYPSAAPNNVSEILQNKIVYLQAIFPESSQDSRYKIVVMDSDGSNKKVLFPDEGSPGIAPQQVKWIRSEDQNHASIGFIYQGNLWIYDLTNASAHQITGDGLTTRLDW